MSNKRIIYLSYSLYSLLVFVVDIQSGVESEIAAFLCNKGTMRSSTDQASSEDQQLCQDIEHLNITGGREVKTANCIMSKQTFINAVLMIILMKFLHSTIHK